MAPPSPVIAIVAPQDIPVDEDENFSNELEYNSDSVMPNNGTADSPRAITVPDVTPGVELTQNEAPNLDVSWAVEHESPLFASEITGDSPPNQSTLGNEAIDEGTNRRTLKERDRATAGLEIGAQHVDERAPNLNLRFFRGMHRASQRRRMREARARRRQEGAAPDQGANDVQGPFSSSGTQSNGNRRTSIRHRLSNVLAQATLVEDGVVEATQVSYLDRKWRILAFALCTGLVVLAALLSVVLVKFEPPEEPTMSMQPSSSPTFDPKPTFEIVHDRGYIKCGMFATTSEPTGRSTGFYFDICRAISSVVLGGDVKPRIIATTTNRYEELHTRMVDFVNSGETYTLEREVRERTTGLGFNFSPYYYDGTIYAGDSIMVACAEEQRRYNECEDLVICVVKATTQFDFIVSSFPSDFYRIVSDYNEQNSMLYSGICNVVAAERMIILNSTLYDFIINGTYVVGHSVFTKDPLSVATRNDDRQWSDIVEWVIQALIFGEEQGLTKNTTLCQNKTDISRDPSNLNFINSVRCVGNYAEIFNRNFDSPEYRGDMNTINRGTGMLYSMPFGASDPAMGGQFVEGPDPDSTFGLALQEEKLNCGIAGDLENSSLLNMSVYFCNTLSAAMFNGDVREANIHYLNGTSGESFSALNNETIDVLVGGKINLHHEFENNYSNGFTFSTPYFYGDNVNDNNIVSFYSMATRQDDQLWSSFVNCVVLSTIYAEENGITRAQSRKMPLVSMFGSDLRWAMRDAISFSGGYGEFYTEFFGGTEDERGRNGLNFGNSSQLLSRPGLDPMGRF